MIKTTTLQIGCLVICVVLTSPLSGQKKITFDDHIKPILRSKCASCHNGDKKSGGLDVTNYTNLMQGGSSGAVVETGDSAESYLYQLVNHDEEPIMPPNSDKLPDKQLKLIADWIDNGALENKKSVSTAPKKKKLTMATDSAANKRPAVIATFPRMPLEPAIVSTRKTAVPAMAASPWSPIVALSSTRQILLMNVQTNQLIGILPFPEGQANVLKFSRNGSLLLAGGGRSGATGKVVVWDVRTGRRVMSVGDELETVLAADISNDHSQIALGGPQKMVRVYNTSTGELEYQIKKHTDWVTSLEFSPDGVLLATGDRNGGVYVWEADTGNEYLTLKGHTKRISAISWRIDSNVVATASEDVSIRLWEMENGRMVKNWGAHGGGVTDMKFSRAGKIVSCGRDQRTKLWEQNGKQIRAYGHLTDIAVSCAICNETQRILTSDWNGEIRLLNSPDGKLLGIPLMNPPKLVTRLANWTARQKELAEKLKPLQLAAEQSAKQFGDLRSRKTAEKSRLDQTQVKLNQTNGQIQATQKVLTRTQARVLDLRKQLVAQQQASPLVKQSLNTAREALTKLPKDATLQNMVNELTKKLQVMQTQVTSLTNQINVEQKQLAANQSKMKELGSTATQLKNSKTTIARTMVSLDKQMPVATQQNVATQKAFRTAQYRLNVAKRQVQRWQSEIEFVRKLESLKAKLSRAVELANEAEASVAKREKELGDAQKSLSNAKASAGQKQQEVNRIEAEIRTAQEIK